MTESINIGFEMLQFISCQIISKQTVTISGNPNYITRIMNYVVTFLIYIITLSAGISWKDLTNLVLALTYHTLPV